MAILLNIDTATPYASVCISNDTEVLAFADNANQKEHAAFLHKAVQSLLQESGLTINELDAIAVTSGPGSYTGLRVGMSAAKGFCFALKIPMITVDTLKVMAAAAIEQVEVQGEGEVLYCPMIDARRMEVFSAVYDRHLQQIMPPQPVVLNFDLFKTFYNVNTLVVVGDGSKKFRSLVEDDIFLFSESTHSARNLAILAHRMFQENQFTDIVYAEPEYYKDFYTNAK